MAQFIGGDGKPFPTQARGGGFNIVPAAKPIRVWAKAPGGLYKYGENIDVCCEFSGNAPSYVAVELVDDKGDPVYYGASLRVRGGVVSIPPPDRRGVFLCRVRYGDKAATCFVATIPDVDKALGGKRAPFGCTNVYDDGLVIRGLENKAWLSLAGNCSRVHDIVDSAAAEAERIGSLAARRLAI